MPEKSKALHVAVPPVPMPAVGPGPVNDDNVSPGPGNPTQTGSAHAALAANANAREHANRDTIFILPSLLSVAIYRYCLGSVDKHRLIVNSPIEVFRVILFYMLESRNINLTGSQRSAC
jgi:hypothetical protein